MKSLDQAAVKIRPMAKLALVITRLFGIAIVSSTSLASVALAQPTKGGDHRGPPAEAVAACKSLAAGAECGFTAERGTMKGSCWAPEGKPLACRPKDAPAPGQQVIPPRK